MVKRKFALIMAVIFAFSLILTACGGGSAAAGGGGASAATGASVKQDNSPVKIGFLGNLAGSDAYIGLASKMALEDYIKELNDKGGLLGRKIELITYDYSNDAATESVNAANRLVNQDKVVAILGPSGSIAAVPIAPIVDAAKVPCITTSATNIKVTIDESGKVHPYMFRVCFIDPYQGTALADFAYKDLGIKKVASIAAIADPYGQGILQYFKEQFTKLGGTVVAELGYQLKDVEFRAQISEAANKGAEALIVPASAYKDAAMIAKQATALGLKFQYLFPDGVYASELLDVAGTELEGAYISNGITEDDPALNEYKKQFAEKHPGQSANIYVAYTLDAMKLLEAAVNKAGSFDPVAIRDAVESSTDVQCFSDKLTMEPETHNPHNKTVSILKITGKKYELYKTYKPEN
ncbi:MAG: ABC transporter substrate-binding protein [Bacillota bacterium]|nr:ABC transporter substrate-binding protein [Bacillota bacterium]